MAKKTKYGSRGKKFIGSTRSGEIVYEGKGRQGKRGKYYKRGAKGRVSGVSQQKAIEASRRGVPVPLGERGATVRSLAIPAQVPSANISKPPTVTTNRQAARRGLRSRTSLTDQSPKVVGSGSGTRTNRLKIPTSVSKVGNKVIGFLKGKAGAFGLAATAWDVGKHIGEVQHMGSQLEVEKKAKARAGEITNMKYKGPVPKKKPSVKSTNATPVKPKVQVQSTPKIEKPKAINNAVSFFICYSLLFGLLYNKRIPICNHLWSQKGIPQYIVSISLLESYVITWKPLEFVTKLMNGHSFAVIRSSEIYIM